MSDRSFMEISEIAEALEIEFRSLYDDAMARYDLYSLRNEPALPEDIAREGQVNVLSPLVVHSAHSIRSDLMSNPTEFTVIPLSRDRNGSIPVRDQRRADNLERTMASLWARMNEGRRIDREIYWHQLVSPFGVMLLEFNELQLPDAEGLSDEDFIDLLERVKREHVYWHISTPDPLTCAFTEKDGQPTLFTRRYKAMVHDVQNAYSHNRGTTAPDLNLRLGPRGQWEWLSDDYIREQFKQSAADQMREVEMIWLDDGETIYHVALNPEDGKGEVVWKADNPYGRVSAFIVHSSSTPLRAPEDRFEPFLWPLMQVVKDLNYIRSMRATTSRNLAGPNNYIPLDAEIIQIFERANKELPRTHRWRRGETPYLLGEVKDQPQNLDPDLDKLEQRLAEDLQRLLPSPFVNVLDPAVLKSATATSILNAAEAGLRMYGPLMIAYDSAIRDICESILYCIENSMDEPVYTYSTGEEVAHGKNLIPGMVFSLEPKDIKFPHRLQVKTRSMTQAQASAQYELAVSQWVLPDGSKGPATIDDLIDAANYADKEAQKEKLAADAILNKIDPWLQEMAIATAITQIEQDLGITLPPPMGMQGGLDTTQQPSGMPNSAQRMDAPMITGPQGGSGPPA